MRPYGPRGSVGVSCLAIMGPMIGSQALRTLSERDSPKVLCALNKECPTLPLKPRIKALRSRESEGKGVRDCDFSASQNHTSARVRVPTI